MVFGDNRAKVAPDLPNGSGGIIGCFGGYQVRRRLVRALGTPDFVVALMEDAVTICGSLWVVSRF